MHLGEFIKAEEDLKQLEKLLPGDKTVQNSWKELDLFKEKHNKEKKSLFKKGLFSSKLYDDKVAKEKGPYPEINEKNLFVYLDILIEVKNDKFKDSRKIKIEIYKHLYDKIALYFFDFVVNNKDLSNKKYRVKKYEEEFYGMCLEDDIDIEKLIVGNENGNLPLSSQGLLILKNEYNKKKEIFINLSGFPIENANKANYIVIGKICFGIKLIDDLNKEFNEHSSLNDFDINQYLFSITDHGKSLLY